MFVYEDVYATKVFVIMSAMRKCVLLLVKNSLSYIFLSPLSRPKYVKFCYYVFLIVYLS
jgi:hypothetical protein